MNARGPRLLIPSGLLGVILATSAMLVRSSLPPARVILVTILAVALADGWLTFRALRRLDATMITPATGTAGEPFTARTTVTGVTRPATVDPLVAGEEPVPFDGPEPFALRGRALQRGVFNHLLVEVRCRSPLGLWTAGRRVAVLLPRPLWIGPAPRSCPLAEQDAPLDEAGEDGVAGPGPRPDLTRAVRPYQPGDGLRLVHWPATAHEGRFMVRETETERGPVPALVVDLHHPGAAAEEALGRAATAARAVLERDGRVRLVTAEPDPAGGDAPIPRPVLLPASGVGAPPVRSRPTVPVDRTETTPAGVLRRLAAAAAAPAGVGVPAGAWVISDLGDHRRAEAPAPAP